MSEFTREVLHRDIRVGNGVWPWWGDQNIIDAIIAAGGTSPLYDGFVPLDVTRELLGRVDVISGEVRIHWIDREGNEQESVFESKQGLVNGNGGAPIGIHGNGSDWSAGFAPLVDVTAEILQTTPGDLGVETCGLLGYERAFVSVGVEESQTNDASGAEFRSHLLACRALDGSLSRTWKRVYTLVVCDNTFAMAMSEGGDVFKAKQGSSSLVDAEVARNALGLITSGADNFDEFLSALVGTPVSETEFTQWRDLYVPLPAPKSADRPGRGYTIAESKRDTITALYRNDARVAPWQGTAFGVLQAANTYNLHVARRNGGESESESAGVRYMRNMADTLNDESAKKDALILDTLELVLN